MKKASITQTKNRLSALIDGLKGAEPVLIVDRGRPVARLEPVTGGEEGGQSGRLSRLIRDGVLRAADALQLAAAFLAAERRPSSLEIVTLDERLADAARREGFELVEIITA